MSVMLSRGWERCSITLRSLTDSTWQHHAEQRAIGTRHQAAGSSEQQQQGSSSERQQAAAASWQQQRAAACDSSGMAAAAGSSGQPEQGARGLRASTASSLTRGTRRGENLATREPERTTCSEHF